MIREKLLPIIKKEFENAEGGHDYWHAVRVLNNALLLQKTENGDLEIIVAASLLHDIADAKFNAGDENIGLEKVKHILVHICLKEEKIKAVIDIIKTMSFKGGFSETQKSIEFAIVQDADRLDAIGAIGIARTFNYGGFKGRTMYDPSVAPMEYSSAEEYRNSNTPSINHFYEKLLQLKELMNTKTASVLAQERHDFMLLYLDQFYKEWND